MSEKHQITRRGFLQTAVTASALFAPAVALAENLESTSTLKNAETTSTLVHPGGSDVIKVGLIGCGGRGTGAAENCIESSPNIQIVAIGDVFKDRVDAAREKFAGKLGDKFKATDDTCFAGFDAYKKVLATDCNLVILATPPGFRPIHLRAAIDAGKHVFMEKPVAVDPVGCRSVMETSDLAAKKGLAIVSGTQRRHDPVYIETIKRIQDGAIGDLTSGQCYWCQGGLWSKPKEAGWSNMEWQIRNWLYFDWLSGDHIVEQHVHNLDVMNWLMGGPPKSAFGQGGRQVRTDPLYGNIFDHFAIEFEYPNGARVISMCRQIEGSGHRVSEFIVGTKGTSDPHGKITGPGSAVWKYESAANINPYVQEHADLIASIREGKPLNEGRRVAESTLTAIMGRISAYTGQTVSWGWAMNSSKLDLSPQKYEMGDLAVNEVPVPGKTKLV